ncbi:sodium-dependent transporter [Hyphococcus luteus]|uniref:Transporter n=1 Tax=Hyphococcus luteus TaxID=2058213 RepID=A0A2S7JZH3_9PROT|nr:sodium-dependent transporter [Marinicaulis flavus]PQA85653.1 sodium-dependent transporter [Marinicaulis flavus]
MSEHTANIAASSISLSEPTTAPAPVWSSRFAFLAAAVGSAVGLGNIWKFPYMAGANGGGAFVILYLGMVAVIGVPILIAELTLGRRGGAAVSRCFGRITGGKGRLWNALGWLSAGTAIVILSFYSIVAGWALAYAVKSVSGSMQGLAPEDYAAHFDTLLANPGEMIFWQAVILGATASIAAGGVRGGLDRAVRWLMPLLALLLVALGVYAAALGDAGAALRFLFTPDFSALTPEAALSAAGHAFFTLSLGVGAMIAYGGYIPEHVSVPRAAAWVALFDTLCALAAGMVIFPIVFAFGLDPAAGPGLIFVTLPVAFGAMPGGAIAGGLFFTLLVIAALTSTLSLIEPMAASLANDGASRRVWTLRLTAIAGALGLVSVFSFNIWSEVRLWDAEKTLFDWLNHLTTEISLPLGGMGVAIFAGWAAPKTLLRGEFASGKAYRVWRFLIRYVAPLAVAAVFIHLVI